MGPLYARGATRIGSVPIRRPAAVVLFALLGACGGGDDADDTVTGRVMSVSDVRVCVSPDRGGTQSCLARGGAPDAIEGVDVGECVETTADLTRDGGRVEVVDEAACAAGDLGD